MSLLRPANRAQTLEQAIVIALLAGAFTRGWSVSVHDGENWSVVKATVLSNDTMQATLSLVMDSMQATDEETLRFRDAEGRDVGTVELIYGNDGHDVVSDYTHGMDEEFDSFMDAIHNFATGLQG